MLYLSLNNTYAETAMEDLRIKHHIDAPSGTEFLYRVKKEIVWHQTATTTKKLDYFERKITHPDGNLEETNSSQ